MKDSTFRAMTDDATFRVVAVCTTATVQEVFNHQNPTGPLRETLGNLVTGAVLVRETMAPNHRVQAIVKRRTGSGSILADSHPTDGTRGLLSLPKGEPELPLQGALLQIMRSLHNGRVHQGLVEIPDNTSISEGLCSYMKSSEQIDSFVATEIIVREDQVVHAMGYLVQLLPEVGTAPLAFMEARIEEFGSLKQILTQSRCTPSELVAQLLEGIDYTVVGQNDLAFGCWCSAERLLSALASLPRSEIDEFVERGELLEIACEYCNKEYQIPPAKLVGLQQQN